MEEFHDIHIITEFHIVWPFSFVRFAPAFSHSTPAESATSENVASIQSG